MRRRWALSALAYVAITCAMGHRVLASLGTAIASDAGDPLLNASILTWNATHVPWTDAWFQFPIFFPTADALTFSEHLLGVSVIASPIYWLTGEALATYNVTLLLTYPLSGLAMYALAWRLTHHPAAAFLAGLAFAFAPYRVSHLPHIQVHAVFWAPLALLGLHAFLETRRPRWLALFGIAWMLQGAANGYFLVYFSFLVALWSLWFVAARQRWRELALIAATAAAAAVPLVPVLYRYVAAQGELGFTRNIGEIAVFAADIGAVLCAPPQLTFWGWLRVACRPEGELFAGVALVTLCVLGLLHVRSHEPRPERQSTVRLRPPSTLSLPNGSRGAVRGAGIIRRIAVTSAVSFLAIAISVMVIGPWRIDLGWFRVSASTPDKPVSTALALLLVAFLMSPSFHRVWRRGSTATFYIGAACVCWVLAWGPFPRLLGVDALYQAPYAWLLQLPGVSGLRAPARFWMMSVMCLSVLLAIVMSRALSRWGRTASAAIATVAACGLVADGFATIPVAAAPVRPADRGALRGQTVLQLPIGDTGLDIGGTYLAVLGGWQSINGYSGFEPAHYEALRTLAREKDGSLFAPFRERGDLYVVVDESNGDMRALAESQHGAEQIARASGMLSYRLPRHVPSSRPPAPAGRRLIPRGVTASCDEQGVRFVTDGDAMTSWTCGVQDRDQEMVIDLGASVAVGAVVHALGSNGAAFPRWIVIETSDDGASWQPAWEGNPAALVLSAALASPRTTRVVFPFAPRDARYVRLHQVGRDDSKYWAIAELEVWSLSSL